MISDLRRKKIVTLFLWLVIISFIGTIFLVWGMGGKADKTNYAIKINGQEITMNEYESALINMENTFKQLFGEQYNNFIKTVDLKTRVKDEIINRTLLYQEALEKKIPVSDREIIEEINSIPSFKTNGVFDKEKYQQILQVNRLSPASFEEGIKRDLLINKLSFLIQNSIYVKNEEIKNEYIYRNSEAKISYIKISPDAFKNKVVINNKLLEEYYNENKEKYKRPKQIKLKYVRFNVNDFIKDIKINDDEIQNYYIKNSLKYYKPETIKVRHILITVKDWDNKTETSEAYEKIKNIQNELTNNVSFEELAKKYSEDPSSAKNGGLIGFIKRGEVVPAFEKAAFNLKKGEISDVVKTQFGYHLIKVDEKIPAKMPALDEIKENIKTEIFENKKKTSLKEHALSFYRDILNEGNISAYMQKKPDAVKVYETEFFNKNDFSILENLNQDIRDALFDMERSDVSKIYYINDNAYIFEISDIKEAYIPAFTELKDIIQKDYVNDKAKEIAIDELSKLVSNEFDLMNISKKYNSPILTTDYFKRIEPVTGIGSNTELQNYIFKVNKNNLINKVFDINKYLYIVKVDDIKLPDLNKLTESEKKDIFDYIREIKSKEALNEYLRNLRLKAKIKISPFIE